MDNGKDSRWETLAVVYNATEHPVSVELPEGKWTILLDKESSLCWKGNSEITGSTEAAPMSALILGKLS